MDKKTIIGIVLIILVTLAMPYYQKLFIGQKTPSPEKTEANRDTTFQREQQPPAVTQSAESSKVAVETPVDSVEEQTAAAINLEESPDIKTIEIQTADIVAVFSTQHGGNPTSWELKKYNYYKGGKVNLIGENKLNTSFVNVNGKLINLSSFNLYADFQNNRKVVLNDQNPQIDLHFYLPVQNGRIVKTITLYKDKYSFTTTISFEKLQNYVINGQYFFGWKNSLPLTEENEKDDNSYSRAFAYMAEELENLDASKDKVEKSEFNGRVDWVASRTKYFLQAIIPGNPDASTGANLSGITEKTDQHEFKDYTVSIDMKYRPAAAVTDTFTVYLGPLDYNILKKYNAELQTLVMNRDWYERLFRPISLLIIPAFKFLHRFIPNYGFVIIIFSILIKLILHPLTKKSYQSMSEMQFLQPQMSEMKEKYKNDPQRLNKEMMKLYKDHGVNPLGGCLPTLLQMPLLFALFIVFRSTIQLRGQPFILWITDLSRPDTLHLGFTLPLIGNSVHVLPILMGITMIWQSKMTMTDPKQKMMAYFMPLFMIFIFYSLPSGLNLYYAIFNILSMIQTAQIKRKMHPGGKAEQLQTVPVSDKKGGKPKRSKK